MYQLRPYQSKLLDDVRGKLREGHKRVVIQLQTGGGKTVIAASMIAGVQARGKSCLFICNRKELLDQTGRTFRETGIKYGNIAAGYQPEPWHSVQIASIETLKKRIATLAKEPSVIIWDECRSLGAAGWKKVFQYFPNAIHIGLDATPVRELGKKGMGEFFTSMVCGPSYTELVKHGALVPFMIYAPPIVDVSSVKIVKGEFDHRGVSDLMDKPKIVGDIVDHWQKLSPGKRTIVFCHSVEQSQQIAFEFQKRGIAAEHVDGETKAPIRSDAINRFRRGELTVLCNVDLFCAGFDVPGVEAVAMARPTMSLTIFLQQCGRGSRPAPGKERCILLDAVGNVVRHGAPEDDRVWELEIKRRKKKENTTAPIMVCKQCFAAFKIASVCPYCGHSSGGGGERVLDQEDGELVALDRDKLAEARNKRREVAMAKTIEELNAIAKKRGYKPGWAYYIMKERDGKNRN